MPETEGQLTELTARIIAAYVENNSVPLADLPGFIASAHAALSQLGAEPAPPAPIAHVPAVSIRKSITPDYLICLEDGKRFKSLKRHLGAIYGLSPDQYRTKWGLPLDYPMVAPNYAEQRSQIAKTLGLGRTDAEAVRRRKAR